VFYTFMEGLRERFGRKEDVAPAPAV
jgi:hypothetical protein